MTPKKPDPSEFRRELNALLKQLQAIVDTLSSRRAHLRGTVYILRRKCGKKPCSLSERREEGESEKRQAGMLLRWIKVLYLKLLARGF